MWHLWIVGEKIKRVGSYEVCSNVTSRAWLGKKMCSFCWFSLRNSFAVFKVCLCQRGELVLVVSVFYYVCCFLQLFSTALDLFWVNWLWLIIIEQTHKQNFKRWKSEFGLSPRFKPFWRGVRGMSFKKSRGVLPYNKPYRYVPPQRVEFLLRFGLKTGLDFAQFGLESGMVFGGTTGVYERIYPFNSKRIRKKEKYAN